MVTRHRFVIRTIKNGKVRVHGKIFRPFTNPLSPVRNIEYDGRLDGMRFAFGVSWNSDGTQMAYIEMWGSEALWKACSSDDEALYLRECENRPDCVAGCFPWIWWATEREPLL